MPNSKGHILVTGGAGYIGSTICNALQDRGWTPIILDDFSSGPRKFAQNHIFYEGDIADKEILSKIYSTHKNIHSVIHCAAKIIVPESVRIPDVYYHENVVKSLALFRNLRALDCKRIVFSSSAAIYDVVDGFMVQENSPLNPSSPYAKTKAMMESVLMDMCAAYDMQGISLRYFNPIGADPKFRSGPYAANPTHILGRMVSVALGKSKEFEITGTDWPTRDGTGIRDYIHVWDLANAHCLAVENFEKAMNQVPPVGPNYKNYRVINLGTGKGVTVLELVAAFEEVTKKSLYKVKKSKRPGDVAGCFASANTAKQLIDWSAQMSIASGIESALKWSEQNS